ncbi:hypothetical protein pdam_00012413, partial [Pocillopora damicornis]
RPGANTPKELVCTIRTWHDIFAVSSFQRNDIMCSLLTEIIPVCTYQYWSAQLFGKPWDNTSLTDLPAQQCFRGF